jgi:hypothetical protein
MAVVPSSVLCFFPGFGLDRVLIRARLFHVSYHVVYGDVPFPLPGRSPLEVEMELDDASIFLYIYINYISYHFGAVLH